MERSNQWERILWSIAFPGFAQFLNGQIIKGIVFMILEIGINVNSHLNLAIMASFRGEIDQAIQQTDYQWLLFYPCI